MELQLIDYKPEYQPYFEKFNNAWLDEYFTIEPFDKWVLENPNESIFKDGGEIFFAEADGVIVGTVALRFIEDGVFELTKMAVDKALRGGGAGKFLCSNAIEKARAMGLRRLILYSNRRLENAIHIYRKLGFTEIPIKTGVYERSDIMMEIVFDNQVKL